MFGTREDGKQEERATDQDPLAGKCSSPKSENPKFSYDSPAHVTSVNLAMDTPLYPPVRIQTLRSSPLSKKRAEKCIEAFIDDFQARSTTAQGSSTVVTVQLQKLRDALRDERKKKH